MGYRSNEGLAALFIEEHFAASSEGGSEVRYRGDLSAGGLPERSVRAGRVFSVFDGTCRYHVGGAGSDRYPSGHGSGRRRAVPAVPGGDLWHRPEPGTGHRRRCAAGHRRRPVAGELGRDFYRLGQRGRRLLEPGHGGLLPISRRVPGDWATPTGLFPFGTTVYGNSPVSPTTRYPYHHLVCGDWWDEQPGSPAYDRFQHVPCAITPPYGQDSEALWTEVQPYQHFIDIKMPAPPDNGAGIFLHDDMPEGYTEGCVALPNAELDAVLGWLNPAARPHILIAIG
jgi:hypothetical protein